MLYKCYSKVIGTRRFPASSFQDKTVLYGLLDHMKDANSDSVEPCSQIDFERSSDSCHVYKTNMTELETRLTGNLFLPGPLITLAFYS